MSVPAVRARMRPPVGGFRFLSESTIRNLGPLAALLVLGVFLTIKTDAFLTKANLINVLRGSSLVAIVAIGMTFVLVSGAFDLSVGATLGFAASVAVGLQAAHSVGLAIAAALGLGIGIGIVNGILVTVFGINAFVATLGMMITVRGFDLIYLHGGTVFTQKQSFTGIGNDDVAGVPYPVIWLLITGIVADVLLRKTAFGRYLFAIGGNQLAATYAGIPTRRYRMWAFVIVGLLAAFAGVILAARLGAVQGETGTGYELSAIAAAVIGGASISGGEGNVWNTIIGALLLQTIQNGFNILNVDVYVQQAVTGGIIIAAVGMDVATRKLKIKSSARRVTAGQDAPPSDPVGESDGRKEVAAG